MACGKPRFVTETMDTKIEIYDSKLQDQVISGNLLFSTYCAFGALKDPETMDKRLYPRFLTASVRNLG